MRKMLFTAFACLLCLNATAAFSAEATMDKDIEMAAGDPEQLIRTAIAKGLEALGDKDKSKAERREAIRKIMLQAADMETIATLSLSTYRRKFSDKQFAEFTDAFSRLLFSTYIGHVENYSGEPVLYGRPKPISETRTTVPVRIETSGGAVPVDFSLAQNKDKAWFIYDVKIEGISLVNNYRSQFREFLVNKPPEALIEQIKDKAGSE